MDHFQALFDRFAPRAQAFFAGRLCDATGFDNDAGRGYLHVLRQGRLRVSRDGHDDLDLDQPTIILMPRRASHGFTPDAAGADLVCATIDMGGNAGNPIALALPDILALPLDKMTTLGPTIDLLLDEGFAERDGRQVALDRLFEYLLVQVIRHIVGSSHVSTGMLAALTNPALARAISAMHAEPSHGWTLDDLADLAGMSRTNFARTFRDAVGVTPIDYLTRWRMTVAQTLLRDDLPIKKIASMVGYDSPAALSRTFTRVIGVSPRAWLANGGAVNRV
ncbi:MAG: AraC family transcriptional regulator [Xanthobacteraceae bacterium]|nr:AraC family transcriptional regulator [Xanthobacteraceae bacterium]MBY0613001.1 AraC family transcriptional regulator [Beijerinckiaceae bacterium]